MNSSTQLKYSMFITSQIVNLILSIILMIFCLLAVFTLCYYIRRRFKLYQEINRITQNLLFFEIYQNYRKNLRIQALIANFIIIILFLEIIENFLYLAFLIPLLAAIFNSEQLPKFLFLPLLNYGLLIIRIIITPVLTLLMNVLWLVYRKYGYKFTIIRWVSYIVIRAFVILTSDIILESLDEHDGYKILLSFICKYMYSSFTIFDLIQFVYSSRKFYLHLKSREKEIKLFYFDNTAYQESKHIRIHFMIATILVTISLFFFAVAFGISRITTNTYILISNIILDNSMNVPILLYLPLISLSSIIIYKILFIFNYLYVFVVVVYQSIRNRQKLVNINTNIKPLVEEYHKTIFNTRYANYS